MIKVSFLGDIMCERPFLNAAKQSNHTYHFDKAFEGIKNICAESDLAVGNLETPFAGRENGYTHEMYSFNTPDSFAEAVKEMGVSCVLTANNHCCDRGIEGLKKTIAVLDQIRLPHTGTFVSEGGNKPYFSDIKGTKLAVISCTASTNALRTGCKATMSHVNLMKEQVVDSPDRSVYGRCKGFVKNRLLGEENVIKLRKALGLPAKKAYADNISDAEAGKISFFLDKICDQIKRAKDKADIVFVCPHMGGQFNVTPGSFSEYAMECFAQAGADAIIASHSHIVQKAELKNRIPCIYSLGNVSMSMSTPYILRQNLPDYGIMAHFYLDKGRIRKATYSLIIMDEQVDGFVMVRTAYDLFFESGLEKRKEILSNAQIIVRRISMDNTIHLDTIKKEFEFFPSVNMGEIL